MATDQWKLAKPTKDNNMAEGVAKKKKTRAVVGEGSGVCRAASQPGTTGGASASVLSAPAHAMCLDVVMPAAESNISAAVVEEAEIASTGAASLEARSTHTSGGCFRSSSANNDDGKGAVQDSKAEEPTSNACLSFSLSLNPSSLSLSRFQFLAFVSRAHSLSHTRTHSHCFHAHTLSRAHSLTHALTHSYFPLFSLSVHLSLSLYVCFSLYFSVPVCFDLSVSVFLSAFCSPSSFLSSFLSSLAPLASSLSSSLSSCLSLALFLSVSASVAHVHALPQSLSSSLEQTHLLSLTLCTLLHLCSTVTNTVCCIRVGLNGKRQTSAICKYGGRHTREMDTRMHTIDRFYVHTHIHLFLPTYLYIYTYKHVSKHTNNLPTFLLTYLNPNHPTHILHTWQGMAQMAKAARIRIKEAEKLEKTSLLSPSAIAKTSFQGNKDPEVRLAKQNTADMPVQEMREDEKEIKDSQEAQCQGLRRKETKEQKDSAREKAAAYKVCMCMRMCL